jgi:PAS domain S-box-containing protein
MSDLIGDVLNNPSPLLDIVCEALPAAIFAYDRNDQIVFASKQILNFFSLPTDVMMPGARLRDFLGAVYDSRPRGAAGVVKGVTAREDWVAERLALHWRERHELTETYGYGRFARMVKRRFPNGTGICVVTDVSEHHKREEQWRADMARVQLTEEILDNIPFPVFVKDMNCAYVAVNRAFCNVRGVGAEDILGRTVFDFAPQPVAAVFDTADRQVLETGETVSVPERLVRPDGHELSVITRKLRIGKPGRYFLLTTMEDVSELTDGNGLGEWQTSRFSATEFPRVETRAAPHADHPFGAHLPVPVETILPERFAGRRALLVCSDVTVEAQASRILNRLGIEFCCVKSALEQEAFLRAAAEFGVDIDVMVIDSQMETRSLDLAEHHGINVLVMDGSAMAKELSYQLVCHFNSPWGRPKSEGNPLSGIEIETIIAEPQTAVSMVDVLVIEDNPVNQIVFSQILEGLGHSYRIAESGREALKLGPELLPRLVLIDQSLPDMSGLDLARELREADPVLGETPLIGVIVSAQGPDAGACLEAGMNGTMMKPISPEAVEQVLRTFLPAEERVAVA